MKIKAGNKYKCVESVTYLLGWGNEITFSKGKIIEIIDFTDNSNCIIKIDTENNASRYPFELETHITVIRDYFVPISNKIKKLG